MKSFYPNKSVNLSQGWNNGNHVAYWKNANVKAYPMDETYGSSAKSGYFLAPFDCKVVKKYVKAGTSNGLWLTSIDKVETPSGKDYVTIMIGHIDANELNKISVGKTYKQFEKIVMESNVGNATGYHHHIVAGFGKMKGDGWVKNSNGKWVLTTTGEAKKPEEIFYINDDIKVKESKGIKFVKAPIEPTSEPKQDFFGGKGYFKLGDKHENIGKIAEFMYKTFPSYTKKEALGNYYGKNIQASIKEFQKRTKLEADGCVGKITLAELKKYGFKY